MGSALLLPCLCQQPHGTLVEKVPSEEKAEKEEGHPAEGLVRTVAGEQPAGATEGKVNPQDASEEDSDEHLGGRKAPKEPKDAEAPKAAPAEGSGKRPQGRKASKEPTDSKAPQAASVGASGEYPEGWKAPTERKDSEAPKAASAESSGKDAEGWQSPKEPKDSEAPKESEEPMEETKEGPKEEEEDDNSLLVLEESKEEEPVLPQSRVSEANRLFLQSMRWSAEQVAECVEAIAELPHLEEFALANAPLGDDGALRFAEQLAPKRLKLMKFADVALTDEGVGLLCSFMPPTLQCLTLDFNSIRMETVQQEARLPASLEALSLRGNRIGDQGATCLAAWLPAGLRALFLNSNQIGDEGAQVLFSSLPKHLRKLFLDFNHIKMDAIPDGLRLPKHLEQLSLTSNCIGDRGTARLARMLPAGLTKLWLDDNLVGDSGAEALAVKLHAIARFRLLDLEGNDDITERGWCALKAALPRIRLVVC